MGTLEHRFPRIPPFSVVEKPAAEVGRQVDQKPKDNDTDHEDPPDNIESEEKDGNIPLPKEPSDDGETFQVLKAISRCQPLKSLFRERRG